MIDNSVRQFWRTRRTRACLTPARSRISGTTSTTISSPTGSAAWIRYGSVSLNTTLCDQKLQNDMNRKSLVERGTHHEDCLKEKSLSVYILYIYIHTLCRYIYIYVNIHTQIYILTKIHKCLFEPRCDLSGSSKPAQEIFGI